jgi:hypothetical protein
MPLADLHVRTVKSMGKVTPVEAVLMAEERKLKAIAIVDHDTVGGVPEAVRAGEYYGKEVIPGVELIYDLPPREIHLIGYFIDWRNKILLEEIDRLHLMKVRQIEAMVEKLQELGMDITYEEVLKEATKATLIGRMNLAQVLVKRGVVKDVHEAFKRYLAYGKKVYVPKERVRIAELTRPIIEAGGVPALAHPKFNRAAELIRKLVKHGLKAIEVYHSTHTEKDIVRFKRFAEKYNLIEVGGTDSDPKGGSPVGTVTVPYEAVEKLRECL